MKSFKEQTEEAIDSICEDCDLYQDLVVEASEYQGRKVKLNDPFRNSDGIVSLVFMFAMIKVMLLRSTLETQTWKSNETTPLAESLSVPAINATPLDQNGKPVTGAATNGAQDQK